MNYKVLKCFKNLNYYAYTRGSCPFMLPFSFISHTCLGCFINNDEFYNFFYFLVVVMWVFVKFLKGFEGKG